MVSMVPEEEESPALNTENYHLLREELELNKLTET